MIKFPSFDEYLKIPYISLSIDGPAGISLNTLHEIFDIECNLLWKKKEPEFIDSMGFSVLRHQIERSFFSEIKLKAISENFNFFRNNHVFVKSSIYDIKLLLKDLNIDYEEITFSTIYNEKEGISDILYEDLNKKILENKNSNKYSIIFQDPDIYLDSKNFDIKNLEKIIFIGSIPSLYGIKSVDVAWCVVFDENLCEKISDILHSNFSSTSFLSEIYALCAIRNHEKITSVNRELKIQNIDYLNSFFYRYRNLYEWTPPKLGYKGLLKLKNENIAAKDFCDDILKKNKLLLRTSLDGKYILICCGQSSIGKSIKSWQEYIDQIIF